ncbi:2820_t:CDS:2 [Gigaspora margarita]|uniref:2820_t:CDS:1 n=1 Tax=Gigaspora margarita TaxID=4874 RepID=A0ABM8W4Y7_GIGMA|nr:2820_t:CDS:2 [Gigaspora margarita]
MTERENNNSTPVEPECCLDTKKFFEELGFKTKPNFCPPYNFPIPKSSLGGQDKFRVKKSENGEIYSPNNQRIRENNKKEKEKKKKELKAKRRQRYQTQKSELGENAEQNNSEYSEQNKDAEQLFQSEQISQTEHSEQFPKNVQHSEQKGVEQSAEQFSDAEYAEQLKVSHAEQILAEQNVEQKIEPELTVNSKKEVGYVNNLEKELNKRPEQIEEISPERKWSFETMLENIGADPNHFTPE